MKASIAVAVTASAALVLGGCGQPTSEDADATPSESQLVDRTISLTRVGGAHVPVASNSPQRQSAYIAGGWRQDDAPLAAAWFATVVDGAQEPRVRAGALAQLEPTSAADDAETRLQEEVDEVEAGRAEVHSDGPDQEAWMPDMRIVGYLEPDVDDAETDQTIQVWGRADGETAQWWSRTITVRWSGEDWRWVAEPWPEQWAEATPPDDLIPYLEGA